MSRRTEVVRAIRRARLRSYELLAIGNAILAAAVIHFASGFEIHPLTRLAEALYGIPFLAIWPVGALLVRLAVVAWRRGRRRAFAYVRIWLRPRSLLGLVRLVFASSLAIVGYGWLKALLPLVNHAVWDERLNAIDTALHFGVNPNRFLIALFEAPSVRRFFDVEYSLFLVTILIGFGWFATTLGTRRRGRFVARYAALWIAGSWIYAAVPAMGPCYAFHDDYTGVHRDMPACAAFQSMLFSQYMQIRSLRVNPRGLAVNVTFGVAAFPSLHVAAQTFLFLWARRTGALALAAFFLAASILTFFGSVLSGWHYAIDGYAGALLAWACAAVGTRREEV